MIKQLFNNWVLIEVDKPALKQGLIALPDTANSRCTGRVIKCGDQAQKLGLEEGQRIAFKPLHGTETDYGLMLDADEDVLGIIQPETQVTT